MNDATSLGDPAATLRLLWREHLPSDPGPRRGPRRGLELDDIVGAATTLADEQGLTALTMRRLAERLGIKPMTLYTYIPGRAELLDALLDDAYLKMSRPPFRTKPWQARVRAVAADNFALYQRHPWTAHLSTLRPPLGPGQMAKYEYELSAFHGSGLGDVATDDALTFLLSFVRNAARDIHSARDTDRAVGTDQQRWDEVGPLLARNLNEKSYPLASRIGSAAGAAHGSAHDPQHAYTFGLEQTLRSIELLAAEGPADD